MTSSITIAASEIASNRGTEHAFLGAMKNTLRRFTLIAALLLSALTTGRAAEPAPVTSSRPQPARWLLIVDTSAAMTRRAEAVEGVVGELLVSGMNGQMRPGDELGVWTFDKELHTGEFPRQVWDPGHSNRFAGTVVNFLKGRVHRDAAHLETVLNILPRLVGQSDRLTVVLLSDGAEKMSGTPFDGAINAAYAQHQVELLRTRMPLATVLRSYRGRFIGHSVSFTPWPLEYPPFPGETIPAASAAPPVAITPARPSADAQPIIIKGPAKPPVVPAPAPLATVEPVAPMPLATAQPVPVVQPVEPIPTPQVVAPEPAPTNEAASTLPAPVPPVPTVEPATAAPLAPGPAVAAAPAPAAGTIAARKWPLILGIGFMWIAVIVALILARRARRANASSLITRSFDHHNR
jgi:hypothetical protein